EGRIVPAGFRFLGAPVHAPAPATHLVLIAPPNVQEGKAVNVLVEAMDAGNHVVTGFKGTVQISLGSADPLATLPTSFTFSAADYRGTVHFTNTDAFAPHLDNYTFQAADNGSHLFAVSFAALGMQTVSVVDTEHAAVVGSVSVNVLAPWAYSGYWNWGYGYWY